MHGVKVYSSFIDLHAANQVSQPIKLLEENIGKSFSDINLTNVFLGQSPKATEIKAKIKQWDLIKLTNFCTAKEKRQTKRQLTEWEKIISNDATDKGLIYKIYKQLIQPNSKKQTTQLKDGQWTRIDISPRK